MNSKSNDQQKYNISAKRDLTAFKELQSFSVYINLFSQTEINGMTRSVFKIIVEDNISHHKYIGYSLEKNKNNIDIFVNYVLSNLEIRGGLDKNYQLVTGRNLISNEDQHGQVQGKIKKTKVLKDNLSHKEILGSIYKELIFNEGYAELEGYTETRNPILPPLFVDSFIRDFDKITKLTDYWRNQKINENDNKILKDTLSEAGQEVEKYQEQFDFDKALKFYKRLDSAAIELADSEKLSAQFLLKQVKIYFHLEQYEKCRDMIETNLKKYEDIKLKDELGELYYYLGMMSSYANKTNDADDYFARSSRLLTKTTEQEKTYIYYRSRIRRFILKNDYENAITILNQSLRKVFKFNDNKELSYQYGLKAEIYVRSAKYNLALENLNIQLGYAQKANDMILESKCIAQMFPVYALLNTVGNDEALAHLSKIKKLSKIINKNTYYYKSLISIAVYLYRNGNENDAEKYFKKALLTYSNKTIDTPSHVVNMIYLSKIRINRKDYLGAIRLLNRMLKLCLSSGITIYLAYIENLIGRIYFERKFYKKSNIHLKKTLKYIHNYSLHDSVLIGNNHKYIGLNYIELKKNKSAIKNLNSAIFYFQKINHSNDEVKELINSIKSKIHEIR